MMKMHQGEQVSARGVANFFLQKGLEEGIPIDQLKLQKLVYYAYAWYLANYNDRLFPEDICAWPHGPVVQELWREFRRFGRDPITTLASEITVDDSGQIVAGEPEIDPSNGAVTALLEKVWDTYKPYTGIQLSNMTHAHDEPWQLMKRRSDLSDRPRIPDDLIRKLFRDKLDRHRTNRPA